MNLKKCKEENKKLVKNDLYLKLPDYLNLFNLKIIKRLKVNKILEFNRFLFLQLKVIFFVPK